MTSRGPGPERHTSFPRAPWVRIRKRSTRAVRGIIYGPHGAIPPDIINEPMRVAAVFVGFPRGLLFPATIRRQSKSYGSSMGRARNRHGVGATKLYPCLSQAHLLGLANIPM